MVSHENLILALKQKLIALPQHQMESVFLVIWSMYFMKKKAVLAFFFPEREYSCLFLLLKRTRFIGSLIFRERLSWPYPDFVALALAGIAGFAIVVAVVVDSLFASEAVAYAPAFEACTSSFDAVVALSEKLLNR
mmetsp:Transcript_7384/g.11237  ORF Transcript_7384/g.11237 Transcript_7384/m.11237 type:complete len:135 (+) Transcript_7384:116-520(+)